MVPPDNGELSSDPLSGDPTALQLFVYGWNNGLNTVNLATGNSAFYGVVYSPLSTLNLTGNAAINGAASANVVNITGNFNFNWDSRAGGLQAGSTGVYYRTAWAQRTTTQTVSNDPGSGCG